MKLTSGAPAGWEVSVEALAEPETLPDTEPEALPAEELESVFLGPQPARAVTIMAAARSRDSFFFI